MSLLSHWNKCLMFRQARKKRGKCAIVNAAILPWLSYKCTRTFKARIPWQSVDKLFLNLLSVSCVVCFLIHALVNLEAPGFCPSTYFLQTYGQLGDDIYGRGWEEKKSSQMSRNSASRSKKSLFYGLVLILNNRIEYYNIHCPFFSWHEGF